MDANQAKNECRNENHEQTMDAAQEKMDANQAKTDSN
jgi:hypothetical protein